MHTGAVVIEAETDSSELISRARAGDLESFDQIMILHQRRVFRTALRILGNLQDAQYTSFVAVDESRVVGDGNPLRILQPVDELPENVSYQGIAQDFSLSCRF